jgi:hypothetical protein
MPTQSESPEAVSGTPSKTLLLLRKRLRQLLRVVLVVTIGIAVAATALALWWLNSLNGLPDIGDPFDVAAFRAFRVPDDQNAFSFLRRAQETLIPSPPSVALSWSELDPNSRQWVEANHRAIELFQQGADQSDASNPAGESVVDGQRLALLVLLEGDTRQERGDTSGAWDCYRAVLRMATHTRRRGSLEQRQDLDAYWNGPLQQRLATWAEDPKTTIPQLRNALDEVLKGEPKPAWDSFAIKAGYLGMKRALEQPVSPVIKNEVGWKHDYRLGDMQLSPDMVGYLDTARRFLLREPERSRRVLQLLCANWLAQVETQEPRPPKPAVRASFPLMISTSPSRKVTTSVPLYPVSPRSPAGARALPPQDIADWLLTTNDVKLRILVANTCQWPWSPDRLRDRRAYRQLVIMLAEKIYHRERGAPPPSEEALVGTYLKSLPDDGSSDLADERTPTVE